MRLATFTLLFLALVVSLAPLSAQMYTGVNPLTFVSTGDETTTTLTSAQLVGRFTFESQEMNFMMKAPSLGNRADRQEQAILTEVLQVENNRLWIMEIDLSSLGLENGRRLDFEEVELPVTIRFNEEIVQDYAWISISMDPSELDFSVQMTVSLEDLNLQIPRQYYDRFSDSISLSTEGKLYQR